MNLAKEDSDREDTAGKMADAVLYLCQVAAAEGLRDILIDLLEVRSKLERIASGGDQAATAQQGDRNAS